MKRAISVAILLCIILPLFGCVSTEDKPKEPVSFYYRRAKLTYSDAASVIAPEARESAGHTEDTAYLLAEYLKGPKSEEFLRTFPTQVSLADLKLGKATAEITLSDNFAVLSGMDLTIACACLTMTVMELTGSETVKISAENALLNNAPQITMDKNCLLLLDSSTESAH